jgi:hypothetical protein
MDLQLYRVDGSNYLVDFRNVGYYRSNNDPDDYSLYRRSSNATDYTVAESISRQAGNQQQHERRCGRGQRDDRRQDQRGLQPVLVLGSRMSLDRRIGVCIVIRGGGIGLYV